jgi:hypothetical protein
MKRGSSLWKVVCWQSHSRTISSTKTLPKEPICFPSTSNIIFFLDPSLECLALCPASVWPYLGAFVGCPNNAQTVAGASADTWGLSPKLLDKWRGWFAFVTTENAHRIHNDFYPGLGRERGSRVKPYVQLVWSLDGEGIQRSAYRSPAAQGYLLRPPGLAFSISFFLVSDYLPVPWTAARSFFLYSKGDTTVAKRHDRQVSSCLMRWLR